MKITVYGSRGSTPFFNKDKERFGGNTLCVRLDIDGHTVILDCGSGINQLASELETVSGPLKLDILIGHLHLDHLIGLSTFSPIFHGENDIRIFTKSRNNMPLASQVFGVFKPPYWPVEIEKMNKAAILEINNEEFRLNDGITVTPFASEHPDGTTAFRINAKKTAVYLIDYEIDKTTDSYGALIDFCKGADVVFFDACYFPEDYNRRKGWGHSTYEHGMELAEAARCRHMVFAHFSPEYTDERLDELAGKIKSGKIRYSLAFDGMKIEI